MTISIALVAPVAPVDAHAAPLKLDLSADSASVDTHEIVLDGDVDVRVEGRRLRADRLRVTRDDRGVSIDGPGELAPCDADRPPVSFGFRRARIDDSGDVTIDGPRLQLGGETVAWLPWLLLRPESEVGLVAPDVGWNGALGAHFTQALRIPIARAGRDAVTVGATAYLDRAAALQLSIDHAALRGWLRVDDGADDARVPGLGVDARLEGAMDGRREGIDAIVATRVDAIRGARAIAEVGAIEPRLRPFDSADFRLSSRSIEVSLSAASLRGGAVDTLDARRVVGAWTDGAALGRFGAIEGGVLTSAMGAIVGAPTWTSAAHADLSLTHALGPIRFVLRGASIAASSSQVSVGGALDRDAVAAGGATFEASLPLADAKASADGAWIHTIEPVVRARAIASSSVAIPLAAGGAWLGPSPATEALLTLAGLRTSYVRSRRDDDHSSRLELTASLWLGRASGLADRPENVGAMRLSGVGVDGSGTRLTIDARAATSVGDDGARAWAAIASATVRDARGLGASIRGTARGVADVRAFEAATSDRELAIDATSLWLARPPSGAASTLGLGGDWPLGRAWSMGADLDGARVDGATTIVRGAARLAFADPCGCLAFRLVGGRLIGRQGVDLLATIELAPVASLPPRTSSR